MISGGHHVDAQVEKLLGERGRDSESSRRIFAVGNHQIRGVLLAQFRQAIPDNGPPGAPKNVTDKKNFQDLVSDVRSWLSVLWRFAGNLARHRARPQSL